ncbi:MAG: hypothetical protein RR066_07085 [Mucinivorans sp.]
MKKSLLSAVVIAVIFTGCKKDNAPIEPQQLTTISASTEASSSRTVLSGVQ